MSNAFLIIPLIFYFLKMNLSLFYNIVYPFIHINIILYFLNFFAFQCARNEILMPGFFQTEHYVWELEKLNRFKSKFRVLKSSISL